MKDRSVATPGYFMRMDLYGLSFEGPGITFYLWSPWRASSIEHRMFEGIRAASGANVEKGPDELQIPVRDAKTYKTAVQLVERVLKGWQEESTEAGNERRTWRWTLEADVDFHGYDHAGEAASVWGFLRLTVEREATPEGGQRGEEIDLNGFGFRLWRQDEVA